MWHDAWWLVKKELRYRWGSLFITNLFVIIVGLIAADFFVDMLQHPADQLNSYILDAIFLLVVPSFATVYLSKEYWDIHHIKNDPFSKQMAFYQMLPISLRTITFSRMLKMFLLYLIQSIVFYSIFLGIVYVISPSMFSLELLLLFILFWFGLSLTLGSLLLITEAGFTMKTLYIVSFIWCGIFMIVYLSFQIWMRQGVIQWTWMLIQQYGGYLSGFAFLLGCVVFGFGGRWLYRRLQTRDYV